MKLPAWKSLAPKWRKLIWVGVWLTVIYGIVGFLVLPPFIRDKAVEVLHQQLGREVTIREVRLNPFALSIAIRGLTIVDPDGEELVAWDEVYVNFELSSLFHRALVFKEVSLIKPYARAQVNRDYSLNFSDLITKFAAPKTNAPAAAATAPSKPLAVRIGKLQIAGARAAYTDLTLRTRFRRIVGPLDITLKNFRTDPENKNPYSFAGTTDAGEKFAWSGYFFLDPLRSHGELSLENLSLVKYAPLYQDFSKFEVRDGRIDFHAGYDLELSVSNRTMRVRDAGFNLWSFKVGAQGNETNLAELSRFNITGANVDAVARNARVESISGYGGRFNVMRDTNAAINVVELAKPRTDTASTAGGVMLLLQSVTNAVAQLLNSTNQWSATVGTINFWDGRLTLDDLVNSRPAHLVLSDMTLSATNLSNESGTNLTATLGLKWNTNGTAKASISASFAPVTLDAKVFLDQIDLHPLDPYLESRVNVVVLGSKLGVDADVKLRTPPNGLPQVNVIGDVRLDDFSTVDGVLGADLLGWRSFRLEGIDANLEPPEVKVRQITFEKPTIRVSVDTNGIMNLLAALNASTPESPSTNAAPAPAKAETNAVVITVATNVPAAALPKIYVGSVVISNAQAELVDRSVTPRAHLMLDDLSGTVSNISSDDSQMADVDLHAKLLGAGDFAITGKLNPLSKNKDTDLSITLTNLDLTPGSPYAGKFAGYRLNKGKLGFNLKYQISNRQLKASNIIELDQFTFGEKTGSTNATKLPVKLAIAVLKDADGKIYIDLPVEGSLDQPNFHIGKVVTRAIFNVIMKVMTSPFSVLGALFGGGEEMGWQEFAPGKAVLVDAEKAKLDNVLKSLDKRPSLQVGIVGSVDPVTDLDGLKHTKLEKQLKRMKWQTLRKGAQAEKKPEELELSADERNVLMGEYLRRYRASATNAPQTNAASIAATAAAKTAAVAVTNKPVGPPPPTFETVKIVKASQVQTLGEPKPEEKSAPRPVPQPPKPVETVEQAALKTINVTDSDFAGLATQRAEAVRAYLMLSNRVDASRVFLGGSDSGDVRLDGSRTYLQLE